MLSSSMESRANRTYRRNDCVLPPVFGMDRIRGNGAENPRMLNLSFNRLQLSGGPMLTGSPAFSGRVPGRTCPAPSSAGVANGVCHPLFCYPKSKLYGGFSPLVCCWASRGVIHPGIHYVTRWFERKQQRLCHGVFQAGNAGLP